MPKKKKDQPKEEILDPETPENDNALEDEGQNDDAETEQALSDVGDRLEDESIPPEEKLELIKAAWDASEAKAAEYLDGWQRAKAEFANYKKRVIRDREQYNQEAVGKVVKNYLSAVDDLERALKNIPQNVIQILPLIARQLTSQTIQQNSGELVNGGKRRSQLMRDMREELVLHLQLLSLRPL